MLFIYDFFRGQGGGENSQTWTPDAIYLVVALEEGGEIPREDLKKIYRQIFNSEPSPWGQLFGPFSDKGQLFSFIQFVIRESGLPKAVVHSASDWNRLLEKVNDTKGLEGIIWSGEVLQGTINSSRPQLFKRFFKDS